MHLEQFYLGCLAHASYLIADEESGVAVVVDPRRDVDVYVEAAERRGWRIEHVYLTHFHADFLAGHLELRERTGARIHLGARAEAEFAFVPEADGTTLELGPQVRIVTMETPGHTPEGITLLVHDLEVSEEQPHAALTGDTLFIGDVGRPDLLASVGFTQAELGRMLYHSLHTKLAGLPDETLVYPAHGAGSLCGKNLSDATSSTFGEQRRTNYALQPMTEEEFLAVVTADQPQAPGYFVHDAVLNRKERPLLEPAVARGRQAVDLESLLARANRGAQVVDTRDPEIFAAGHLAGSLNIGLDGKFATWAGTVLDLARPVLVITEPGREEEAVLRLGRIGIDSVEGVLEGGAEAFMGRPELVARFERLEAAGLEGELQGPEPPVVLDVRAPGEHAAGHLEGALHLPLGELAGRLEEVPRDRSVVVHCAGGYRSVIAISLLQRAGFEGLRDLRGGFAAWEAAGLPVVAPAT